MERHVSVTPARVHKALDAYYEASDDYTPGFCLACGEEQDTEADAIGAVCGCCGCNLLVSAENIYIGMAETGELDPPYEDQCRKAGWEEFTDNDVLEQWCDSRSGIAHGPTVRGEANANDSVYSSWRDCYWEAIADQPPSSLRGMNEGWGIFWSDSRGWELQRDDGARVFETDDDALDFVKAKAAAGSAYHRDCLAFLGVFPD